MIPGEVRESSNPIGEIMALLQVIHEDGPDSPELLEKIILYKVFHPESFSAIEERLVSAMGLFHKKKEDPDSGYVFSFV